MSALKIDIAQRTNATIVRLAGDGSMHNLKLLTDAMANVSAGRPSLVVADLTELTFVSSLVLGALLESRKGLQRWGGDVRIAGARSIIADVFRRTRLDEVFAMHETVEDALRAAVAAGS